MITKIPETILPDNLILSVQDRKDLCELEETYLTINFYSLDIPEKFNLSYTSNVGIHYFCVENKFHLSTLASNKNLTEPIIYLLYNKLKDSISSDNRSILYNLLRNPTIYENKVLFETIFIGTSTNNEIDILIGLRNMVFSAPINILMFILPYIGNLSSMVNLVIYYVDIAMDREEEILEWVTENTPEFTGLPLSWILKAYHVN